MLNDDICKKRDELNQSIAENKDYSIIYRLSVELDELIAEFYRKSIKNEKRLIFSKKIKKYCKKKQIRYNKYVVV